MYTDIEEQILRMLMEMMGGLLVIFLAGIAAAIFLGLCVYNDARYRGDGNAALWGVLSGFFPIAALIYIIVKLCTKKRSVPCLRCGYPLLPGYFSCPSCGQPVFVDGAPLTPERLEKWKGRRTLFLVLFIVGEVLTIIVSFAIVANVVHTIMELGLQAEHF